MANEFGHQSSDRAAATKLTQAEFDKITAHQFDSQATGDLMYASSATQLSRLGIGSARQALMLKAGIPAWLEKGMAVVDAAGKGDFTTIQAADDELDAGAYALYIVKGTYAENVVVSTANAHLYFEPLVDLQGSLTMSGAAFRVDMGGGVLTDGLVLSGDDGYVDGGGFASIMDGGIALAGINSTGDRLIVKNISCKTTGGGGTGLRALLLNAIDAKADRVRVIDSDNIGIVIGNNRCAVSNCEVIAADTDGIGIFAAEVKIIGNHVYNGVVGEGINVGSGGDNTLITGNISNSAGAAIVLDAGGDNCIVDGNRTDGAITDNSTGSTIGDNEATAF